MTSNINPFVCQKVEGPCKIININKEIVNQQTEEILEYVGDTFKIERGDNGVLLKLLPSNEVIDILAHQLHLLTEQLSPNRTIPNSLVVLLRSLRNSATDSEIQSYIVYHTDILENVREIFNFILFTANTDRQYLKTPLQFLINLVSSNESSSRVVYKNFISIIQECLYKNWHIYECSALLYNISRYLNISTVLVIEKLFNFTSTEYNNEYIHFLMENVISSEYFWTVYKDQLSINSKVILLEFLRDKLVSNHKINTHLSSLDLLSEEFIKNVDVIFHTNKDKRNDCQAYHVSLILQILASLSSNENYLPLLQTNKDLFINTGVVLINIHKLGKMPNNCFTPIQKLEESGNNEWNQHPAFGFKADLIRLIGNMCWKNVEMQNLVRTAELIPVVLDCCNMDAKNPFIIQWCILAIRNICDGNIENQKVISGLHQEGTVSTVVLEEMGITLHSDGEHQLKIVSLNDLKRKN